jgi:hypothetical protein
MLSGGLGEGQHHNSTVPVATEMPVFKDPKKEESMVQCQYPLRDALQQMLTKEMTQVGYAIGMLDSRHKAAFLREGTGVGLLAFNSKRNKAGAQIGCVNGPRRNRATADNWLEGNPPLEAKGARGGGGMGT